MRPLRWKSRYQTGDAETDRRNRKFIDCFNSLINAAGKREHCQEMEEFIGRFSVQVEQFLHHQPADSDLGTEFGRQLITNSSFGVQNGGNRFQVPNYSYSSCMVNVSN